MTRFQGICAAAVLLTISVVVGCAQHRQATGCADGCCSGEAAFPNSMPLPAGGAGTYSAPPIYNAPPPQGSATQSPVPSGGGQFYAPPVNQGSGSR